MIYKINVYSKTVQLLFWWIDSNTHIITAVFLHLTYKPILMFD